MGENLAFGDLIGMFQKLLQFVLIKGVEDIRQIEMNLIEKLIKSFKNIPQVKLYGPKLQEDRIATLSFNFAQLSPSSVALRLEKGVRHPPPSRASLCVRSPSHSWDFSRGNSPIWPECFQHRSRGWNRRSSHFRDFQTGKVTFFPFQSWKHIRQLWVLREGWNINEKKRKYMVK